MKELKFSLAMQEKSRDLYRVLVADDRPKSGATLTYGEAAKRIAMKHHRPIRFPLEIIQDACTDLRCPNITVLVVQQGEGLPGDGCTNNSRAAFAKAVDEIAKFKWPPEPWW